MVPPRSLRRLPAWTWARAGQTRTALVIVACPFVVLLAHTGLRWWLYGDVLPNTYYLKVAGIPLIDRLSRGGATLWETVQSNLWLTFALGLLVRADERLRLVLVVVVTQVCYSVWVGGDAWEQSHYANRYVAAVLPLGRAACGVRCRAVVLGVPLHRSRAHRGSHRPNPALNRRDRRARDICARSRDVVVRYAPARRRREGRDRRLVPGGGGDGRDEPAVLFPAALDRRARPRLVRAAADAIRHVHRRSGWTARPCTSRMMRGPRGWDWICGRPRHRMLPLVSSGPAPFRTSPIAEPSTFSERATRTSRAYRRDRRSSRATTSGTTHYSVGVKHPDVVVQTWRATPADVRLIRSLGYDSIGRDAFVRTGTAAVDVKLLSQVVRGIRSDRSQATVAAAAMKAALRRLSERSESKDI